MNTNIKDWLDFADELEDETVKVEIKKNGKV